MKWWVITELPYTLGQTGFFPQPITNLSEHLFCTWDYIEPTRTPIWKTVRGVLKMCGYYYKWHNPNYEEQAEPGETLVHSFPITGIAPLSTIWYYFHSPLFRDGHQCQSQLMSVTMASPTPWCDLARSTPLTIPNITWTPIPWTVEWADAMNMHDPALPSHIKAPLTGLYLATANIQWAYFGTAGYRLLSFIRNGAWAFPRYQAVHFSAHDNTSYNQTLSGLISMNAGEYLEACVYHTFGSPIPLSYLAWSHPRIVVAKILDI